ncbi:hypothetical protein [Streptomyces sp. NPDC001139]
MGLLDRIFGNDHERAARYDGPSASETAAAKRRAGHRRNIARAAAQGEAWEDADRSRFRTGSRWNRTPR